MNKIVKDAVAIDSERNASRVIDFIRFFFVTYPRRSVVMIVMLVMSGLAEGLGIISLVPLLEMFTENNAENALSIGNIVRGLFDVLGANPSLGSLLIFIVFLSFLKAVFLWAAIRQVGYTIANVTSDLRLRLLSALMWARWGYFIQQPVGRLSNALGWETAKAATAYQHIAHLVAGMVSVVIYLVIAAFVSWQVVVIAVIAGSSSMYLLRGLVRMSRTSGSRQARVMKTLSARFVDALHGIKPIKAMRREHELWALLKDETEQLNQAQRQRVLAAGTMDAVREPIVIVVLSIGLFLVLSYTDESFAAILILVFLFNRSMMRLTMLQRNYQAMANSEAAFWSLHDTIKTAEENREQQAEGASSQKFDREIKFDGVTFSYGDAPVLRDVNISIPAGQFVSLIGPSGAGKTTLVDLMLGLYQPQVGEILIDEVPLQTIDIHKWRESIGYVPQEMFLFHESIYKNVVLGDMTVDRAAVENALKLAGVWDHVEKMPYGMDTVVGERGSKLSGGQRQRIALARAIVRRPCLLLLDEVTANLDPNTEAAICDTLKSLQAEMTIISVSHQPALIAAADVVYEIRDGVVRQSANKDISLAVD